MPLSPTLAEWPVGHYHDAVHAGALGLGRAPDTEIMDRAVREVRTVITADLDYPRLLALAGASGPSLILFRGGDWCDIEVIDRMGHLLRLFAKADIVQSIVVVSRDRVRRRRLQLR
jgi:predicted nuclease of predicted toxin-antitoxin system